MKKLLLTLAAVSLLGVACSRDDAGLNNRADDTNLQQEQDMGAATGTGYGTEGEAGEMDNSELGTGAGEMEEGNDIQREEEMDMGTGEEVRMQEGSDIGTGAGSDMEEAGSSDASGMGMEE